MITSARIEALRQDTDLGWLTALRAPAVAALAAEDGPLQLSLFDQVDLAEITHPDYTNGSSPAATRCSRPTEPAHAASC